MAGVNCKRKDKFNLLLIPARHIELVQASMLHSLKLNAGLQTLSPCRSSAFIAS